MKKFNFSKTKNKSEKDIKEGLHSYLSFTKKEKNNATPKLRKHH